ncbi:MAG: DUF58 domain-containing protein, partial [Planctomycetaceae bacterium]|nr:DUF58 domain-containing protein [Planctomycetaceae bacterium]
MLPRLPLLLLYLSAVIPLAGGIAQPQLGVAGFWLTVLITVVALVDRLISPGPEQIEVERQTASVLSVGRENSIRLVLRNRGQRLLNVQLHDTPPQPATILGLPLTVPVPGHSIRIATWKLIPGRRGNGRFGDVSLQCLSRLKLWTLLENRPLPAEIRLYPDIQAVQGVELLARQNRLSQAGVRLSRLRGRGSDFDRLREYRREDEYRSIDWKATARHQQLISREYVVEKNQTILFLLDCGRSMCNEADGISHFDRALNAVILLSCVALRQGDSVGVLACSNAVERWVAPLHGRQAVRQLTGRIYDLQPRYEATDYDLMISELR